MTAMQVLRRACVCAGIALAVFVPPLLIGCAARDGRCAVEGRVSFDGQPVEEGVIALVPAPSATGPSAGAEIRDGRYAIARAGGPLAGQRYRVEITSYRKTGRRLPIVPDGPPAYDEKKNVIPEVYNVASTLAVTVEPRGGVATLDFDLASPPKK